MATKICRRCKIEKPLTSFYRNKRWAHKDGRDTVCAACRRNSDRRTRHTPLRISATYKRDPKYVTASRAARVGNRKPVATCACGNPIYNVPPHHINASVWECDKCFQRCVVPKDGKQKFALRFNVTDYGNRLQPAGRHEANQGAAEEAKLTRLLAGVR